MSRAVAGGTEREPIAVRSTKLNHLVLGRGGGTWAERHLASRDSLLDALLALYEECSREQLRRDKNIALFLEKYRGVVTELRKLRISIADFEVKTVIGRGHFGDIHMVKEKATGDIYAMKVLRKDDTLSQQEVAFYEEERDILARASQAGPWLTRLQYAFQDASHLYLVMEFLPGGDLFALLDRSDGCLPEDAARFYLSELVLALHALHSLGYVHRDIKPDNVLIDRTGHIKLADFGSAAKLTNRKSALSRLPVGTPHYVAPELLSAVGGGAQALLVHGTGCDWWSLGVVAYEMLFGQNPFADDRVAITYHNIMNFKESLKFPEDTEVSATAIKMVAGLLSSANERLSYDDLCRHEFFAAVDWNNVRQTVPPFVPSLCGEEDTSNFFEFEAEQSRPRALGLGDTKKGFEGRHLPFVGFTHTQCSSSAGLDRTTSLLEVGSPLRGSLSSSAGRQDKLQERVTSLVQQEEQLRQEIQGCRARLEEARNRVAHLETALSEAEGREAELRSDNQNLNMLVELERKNRLVSEEKAVQMLNAIKRKYRRQDELLRSGNFVLSPSTRGNAPRDDLVANGAEGDTSSLQKELNFACKDKRVLEEQLTKERTLCATYKDRLNQLLAEGAQCMDDMHKKHVANVEYIDNIRKEVAEAAEKQHRAEEALSSCRRECRSQQERIADLEADLSTLRRRVDSSAEAASGATDAVVAAQQQQKTCTDQQASLLGKLKVVQDERDRLSSEAAALRSQLSALQEEWTSREKREAELLHEAEGLRSVVARLEEVAKSRDVLAEPGSGVAHASKEVQCLEITHTPDMVAARLETDDEKTLVASGVVEQDQGPTQEALAALEAQLSRTREFLSTSRARCGELQAQLRKKEEELSEAVLDARIAKRDAKSLEERDKSQRETLRQLREESNKLKTIEATLSARVAQLEEALAQRDKDMALTQLNYETEKAKLEERVQMLRDGRTAAKDLEAKCVSKADECRELTVKCKVLELEAQREAEARSRVAHDSQDLEEELKKERAKTEKLLKTLQILKETCEKLDEQVVDYETMLKQSEERNKDMEAERNSMKELVDKLNQKIFSLKESLLQEKTARKRLSEDLEGSRGSEREAEAALESLQASLAEREALVSELGERTQALRKELASYEASAKAWQRKEDSLLQENLSIKEEATRHITTIASLKSSNLALSHELEEARERQRATLEYAEQLEADIDGQKGFAEMEQLKLSQTLAQQSKLIDFLQAKLNQTDKKKKKLFGGKGGKENAGLALAPRVEAEGALERERSKSKGLQDQLDRARAEVMALRQQLSNTLAATATHGAVSRSAGAVSVPTSPKSRALLTALTLSPSCSVERREAGGAATSNGDGGTLPPPPPLLRMQHNIPHRFQAVLCMRATKCAACLDSVHFGRYASRCQECQVVCHPKCSLLVPSTCGVPAEYVRQFSDSVDSRQSTAPCQPHVKFAPGAFEMSFDQSRPRGWVKVPRSGGKQGWDKCFMVLCKDTLYLLDHAVEPEALEDEEAEKLESLSSDRLCLGTPDGEAVVSGAVSATELMGTARSDLPYTFKVELKPLTTCWPPRCLYIMVPTFAEKQMWVTLLEECVSKNVATAHKNAGDTVLVLEGDKVLDINCTYELSYEHLLLGAMEGLFVVDLVSSTMRHQVPGVPAVFQVGLVTGTGVALAICGDERHLRLTDWAGLSPWVDAVPGQDPQAEESQWHLVEETGQCHLFAHSQDGHVLCVATDKQVHLLRWNPSRGNYTLKKVVSTAEPCSCIHFTQYTVLVGTDTFYEIDIKDYSVESFLDPTDTSLSFLIYGVAQLRSFPVSILQVAPPEYNPEYLLCFHEFGVFVDSDGRRTREDDLKWSRLPLAFAYKSPYLFVGHFNSVEILEIKARGIKESGYHRIVMVNRPRFLGLSSFLGSMYLASYRPGEVHLLSVRASDNSPSAKENGDAGNEDLEFSFTSSVVEMLDD